MLWGAALAALGFTGCKDDDPPPMPQAQPVTVTATAENNYGDALSVVWTQGDKIGLFAGQTLNAPFVLTGAGGAAAGSFGGELLVAPQTYYAYYPYDAATTIQAGKITVKIPDRQTYYPDRLMPGLPMTGASPSVKIQMRNLCGLLAVRVAAETPVTVSSLTFTADGQRAAGRAEVALDAADPVPVLSDSGTGSVTLAMPDGGVTIDKGASTLFYLALAPQTYQDAEIVVASADGRQIILKPAEPLTIARSQTTQAPDAVFAEPKPQGLDLNDPAGYGITPPLAPEVYANCYRVEQAGVCFFNARVIGNGPDGLHPDGGFHTRTTRIAPVSAALLWEEAEGTITDVKLSAEKTYLLFNAVRVPGNAVVAVYDGPDGTGNILWSWHIWLSEKPRDHQYKNTGGSDTYLVMDRNLGATFAPATDIQADIEALTDDQRHASYGLHYQWGRKDPFWGCSKVSGRVDRTVFGRVTTIAKVACTEAGSSADERLLYAVRHPVDFVLMDKSTLHWTGSPVTNLWGNPTGYADGAKGRKTIYDPCPVGYMVPPFDLWSGPGFDQAYVGKFKRGRMFSYDGENIAWYPSAGLRWEDDGELGDVAIGGYYWSNTVFDAQAKGACEYLFTMSSTEIFPTSVYSAASGHSIRCVRE